MTQSLWQIPDISKIRTPLSILREQGDALTLETNSVLKGIVSMQSSSSELSTIILYIQVPALNNYLYQILTYIQPITLYPGRINPNFNDIGPFGIANEEEFVTCLGGVLASEQVKRILESLLAQALSR